LLCLFTEAKEGRLGKWWGYRFGVVFFVSKKAVGER